MRGSASGKVILVGEHFVVYGYPAIVSGIDKKLRVILRYSSEDRVLPEGWMNEKTFSALAWIRRRYHLPPLDIKVFSEFPVAAGLGSSAAFSVALGRALGVENILSFAHEVEKFYHGNPSGIDTAAAYYGRPLIFRRNGPIQPLDRTGIRLLLVYSGPRDRSTKELVQGVGKLKEERPKVFESLARGYLKVFQGTLEALRERDLERLGHCFNVNQSLLRSLGVSSSRIERVVSDLKKLGALGAKLTGAGDGGFVIGVFDTVRDARYAARKLSTTYPHVLLVSI